jgi:hypothetical protein
MTFRVLKILEPKIFENLRPSIQVPKYFKNLILGKL